MDADLDQEVCARSAMASQAFEELRKPVFLNKAIASSGRQQLYHSLVLSRLLYGCAVWSDLSASQVHKLESMILNHHRRIHDIGLWNHHPMTDAEFRVHSQLITFRILWARHRLIYLQAIGRHGMNFHVELLLLEFLTQRGWLWDVREDLRWLLAVVDLPITLPTNADDWRALWTYLATSTTWKATVKRACRHHLLQEKIAWTVNSQHDAILQCLRASLRLAMVMLLPPQHPILLAVIVTRPSPLNKLWQATHIKSMVCFLLRAHTSNLRPALGVCETFTVRIEFRIALRQRIAALRLHGEDEFAWWWPSKDPALVAAVCSALHAGLLEWCNAPLPTEIHYHNTIFEVLFSFNIPDLQAARIYIHWVETEFYDAWPPELDPDLASLLDKANLSLLEDLPTWRTRHEMSRLTTMWINLPADEPEFPPLPSPLTSRPYDRLHPIARCYAEMAQHEARRCHWRLLKPAVPRQPSSVGPFYVIHLYSGGRRTGDFHDWTHGLLEDANARSVRVLSIDTAIHDSLNIHDSHLWGFLCDIIAGGRCIGLLMGPPCETWSSARHQQCLDANGVDTGGPRPLRHGEQLWGLEKLTWREMLQLLVGSELLLKGLFLACCAALNGSATFVEHPAPPFDPDMACIWRLGLLRVLMRFPEALFRITIAMEKSTIQPVATQPVLLSHLARRLVDEAHAKSEVGPYGLPDTPIGLGGKMDDTSVVVGEVVEWTKAHSEVWAQVRKQNQWRGLVSCPLVISGGTCRTCRMGEDSGSEHEIDIGNDSDRFRSTSMSVDESDDEGMQ
eukprot:s492_g5.t1